MSHALSAIDLALRGDASGLSFLEQTAAIYVLDAATTPGRPTTYGWWNFLNDALNEVERFETSSPPPQLDAHVRLLATITRRVARRPPASDRRLIGTCLANASMSHMHLLASPEMARSLLSNNDDMRERNMGRIASIVFDFSFHRKNSMQTTMSRSAFSDPVVMEQLCGVVAANAVSTGPDAVKYLVADWIIPSIESMPPYSVVAILSQIAVEAMGKGCPVGTKAVIKSLLEPVLQRALGPLMVNALRESDGGDDMDEGGTASSSGNMNHRVAALALRALENWCNATSTGMIQLRRIFSSTNINILEGIADALYSDAEIVIDAVSDLLDVVLQLDTRDSSVSTGLSIAHSLLGMMQGTGQFGVAQELADEKEKSRIFILTELVSAIGLQRFRFSERQARGDTAVCRCLARTASRILLEAQDDIRKGAIQVSLDGLFDLLFKATSHPSVYVCGIALEALSAIAPSDKELSTRMLPLLQGKAIIPFHFISGDDMDGFDDYRNFRDRVLNEALVACYAGCGSFYLQSCCLAIEEFCVANPSPHLPYQLEAALFCMVAVSGLVVKKIRKYRTTDPASISTDPDAQQICADLGKIISALAKNAFASTSQPLVMAEMCRFLNEYAVCFPLCPSDDTFESASELALSSFNRCLNENNDDTLFESYDMVSPMSEASHALQQLLHSSPAHFSSPTAVTALESAWKMPYSCQQVAIKDRESLCSGLCSVIASLPSEQWGSSLDGLSQPVLSCLNVLTKEADDAQAQEGMSPLMKRLSNEIFLLSAIVRCFNQAEVPDLNQEKNSSRRNVLIALLHKCWPCLKHIGEKYSSYEVIVESIGQLLSDSLCLYKSDEEMSLLQELASLAKTSLLGIAKTNKPTSLSSLLSFIRTMVELHGHKADANENNVFHGIVVDLIIISYEAVRSCSGTGTKNGTNGECGTGYATSPDIVAPMFATLSSCAKHCPKMLVKLARVGQPMGELLHSSVEATPDMLKASEVGVASSSVSFLKVLIATLDSLSVDGFDEASKTAVLSAIHQTKGVIKTSVLAASVTSICGVAPQEVIGQMTDLIQLILTRSQWNEVEVSITTALNSTEFKLGEEVKSVMVKKFKQCSSDGYPPVNFDDIIANIWGMHQADDTGAIAGGEEVFDFVKKHGRNAT